MSAAPTLLAFALNLDGVRIFREPPPVTGPALSGFIFMLALFCCLAHLDLYPACFRPLWGCGKVVTQFFIAQFLFEQIMLDFWYPLEDGISCFINYTLEYLEQIEALDPLKSVFDALKCDTSALVASYMLSTFALVASLHASKLVDLQLLSSGFGCFVQDISKRLQEVIKTLKDMFSSKPEPVPCSPKPKKKCKKIDEDEDDACGSKKKRGKCS